ncbi:MAG: beta-aspartyl-peptidase [Kangiella sp.]|nr:MAG: beta-aspartyl-peptidase [Kangiella sp.]
MLHRLRNINLYSPEPVGLVNILIASDKIVAISKDDIQIDSQWLTSDEDYQGKRVIPGFIDGHAHITGGGGEAGFKTKVPPVNLSQYTSAGVTSVVGLLGTDDITRNTSSLIAQVYALREEGISAWCYTGGYHVPLQTLTGSIKKDIIHIEPVIGVGELAISDHRSSQPTFDEIARIVGDAHVAGIMTGKAGIVHFHLGDGSRKLALIEDLLNRTELPPRTLNPTHCNRNIPLFEQACELTKRGISIDVTAFPESDSSEEYSAKESFEIFHKKKLDQSKLTISSDGGGCLPQFDTQGELIKLDYGRCSLLSDTFKELLDQGYPEEQVLLPFTKNVADLLRLSQKGEIKVGNDADLIVLDEENQIESVMALGKWHKKNGMMLRLGSFE